MKPQRAWKEQEGDQEDEAQKVKGRMDGVEEERWGPHHAGLGGVGAVHVLSCGSWAALCLKATVVPQAQEQCGLLPNCSSRHGPGPPEGGGGDGRHVPVLRAL